MTLSPSAPPEELVSVLLLAAPGPACSLAQAALRGWAAVQWQREGVAALPDVQAAQRARAVAGLEPALVVADAALPGLELAALCQAAQGDTSAGPVVVVLDAADEAGAAHWLQQGAADCIGLPQGEALLAARLQARAQALRAAAAARAGLQGLQDELALRTAQLQAIQDVTTLVMATLAETRGTESSNHIRRTQYYVKALGWRLSTLPHLAASLTSTHIDLMFRAAALHDIGKAGIPDRILLKPGRLSPDEFEIMKTHTTLGRDAIANAKRKLGVDVDYLNVAKEIAYSHHEKWDGSGYPEGLAGSAIPLSGRLMALADVYDALISRRLHKEAMSHEQATHIIQQTRGRHFDPDVVDAFLAVQDNFQAVAIAYSDSSADLQRQAEYAGIAQV
jgi:putative two-component system response regulator